MFLRIPFLRMETIESARKIFSDYLDKNGWHKTVKRFAILDELHSITAHFYVELLYTRIKNKKHNGSRSTLNNPIELLLSFNLITRHRFKKNLALQEKSFEYKQHDQVICNECEKVFDFCDQRIQQTQSTIANLLNFAVTHHSLNLFGSCNTMKETGTCEYNSKHKTN
jgi:Fur family ferric uptake transcriptional regulator